MTSSVHTPLAEAITPISAMGQPPREVLGGLNSIPPRSGPKKGGTDISNPAGFNPVDIGVLLEAPEEVVPWVIEDYLAEGSLTLLAGSPKLGKSTLAYDAIISVATGQPFLSREVTKGTVLLLGLEEHRRDIVARFRGSKEKDLPGRVKLLFAPLPYTEPLLQAIERFIAREGVVLVVVDTIHAWWGLSDENDAAEVLRKVLPLLNTIRRTKAAWLGLAHTRKGGGEHGQEIRGSSALLGLVD